MSSTGLKLYENGGNGIFIQNSTGYVGIGETSPGTLLDIAGAAPYLTIHNSTEEDGDYGRKGKLIFEGEQSGGELTTLGEIEFAHDGTSDDQKGIMTIRVNDGSDGTSPTAAMTIDSGGNVGIGTASPQTLLDQAKFSADATGSYHTFSKSRNAVPGSHTIVQDNDIIGGIKFAPSDGTDFGTISAMIQAEIDDSAPAASSVGGALTFSTAAGVASDDLAERMRINKDGNVGIGTTTPDSLLDIEDTGTVKANEDVLHITNKANAADMDGTETSILFNQWYYDAATPAVADAGRISIGTEQDWTSVASTQDSYMAFETALDGTVTEHMRIDSNGDVGIGVTGAATDKLEVYTNDGTNAGLTVQQDGAGNIVNFKDGSTTVFSISGSGDTTIGNSTETLTVVGSLDLSSATTTFKEATESLVPEYAGSAYYADGSDNVGTLSSDYDSTNYHNYYRWTTSSDNQDYDIVVRWLVPEDFNGFDTDYDFKIFNRVSDTSGNTAVDISMRDTANAAVSFEDATLQNASWTETTLSYSGTPTFSASTSSNRYWITFQIKLTADNGDTADVGEITFRYNRQQ